ncbi:hypothetical protein ACVRY7_05830 [Streptococcus ictaluri]|uniref:Uncharacterized protein n=1 Tax=Streptococcus ictaluri 707-05 TaxID=764299 RepID=G5K608_9STRE|nr:hypothetical protein [Streptococcus ictaluri]EHI68739.1 hypothetical protein STRIC_0495 [Streptococcus ictaluri 707-05]
MGGNKIDLILEVLLTAIFTDSEELLELSESKKASKSWWRWISYSIVALWVAFAIFLLVVSIESINLIIFNRQEAKSILELVAISFVFWFLTLFWFYKTYCLYLKIKVVYKNSKI